MSLWNGKPMASGVRDCLHMPAGPMRRTRALSDNRPLTREQIAKLGGIYPRDAFKPTTDRAVKNAKSGKRNPGRLPVLTKEQIEKAERMIYSESKSFKEAQEATGCSLSRLYAVLADRRHERAMRKEAA